MRGSGRVGLLVTPLLCLTVVMAAPAVADGEGLIDQAQYEAAYAAAADASGVFAPATSVTFTSKGKPEGDLTVTVNPDGSLLGSRTRDSVPVEIRCVRVDRCWERSLGAYGDRKWHRLTAGSVEYQAARDDWSTWMGFPWPSGSVFSLSTTSDGSTMFLVGVRVGDSALVNGANFSGPSVQNMVMVGDGAIGEVVRSGDMSASTVPVAVTAPLKRAVGVPATQFAYADMWIVPINPPA